MSVGEFWIHQVSMMLVGATVALLSKDWLAGISTFLLLQIIDRWVDRIVRGVREKG
jgi:uncharacterized membrane protein YjjP (DUF1212 family)